MKHEDKRVRVWDRFVRLFHWGLVTSFAAAYFSTVGSQRLHEWAGYTALSLVGMRIVWGFIGSERARFSDFVPGPRHLWTYLRGVVTHRAPRYLGHNPGGAVMILLLLCMVISIGVSGWMMTLDAFWGDETVQEIHAGLVNFTLVAVALHVSAAIYESFNHRENLILSMFSGTKRAYTASDIAPTKAQGETAL